MTEEIEVWKDSEKRLSKMDEDRYMQYYVWVEVAQTDPPEFQQIPQEWVYRKSQPAPEIIFKQYSFIGMRHGEGLTEGRRPSGGDAVRQNACLHQSIELCPSCS